MGKQHRTATQRAAEVDALADGLNARGCPAAVPAGQEASINATASRSRTRVKRGIGRGSLIAPPDCRLPARTLCVQAAGPP